MNSCGQFKYVTNLLQLGTDEPNTEQFDLKSFLLSNSHTIDKRNTGQAYCSKKHSPTKPGTYNHGTKAFRELSALCQYVSLRIITI